MNTKVTKEFTTYESMMEWCGENSSSIIDVIRVKTLADKYKLTVIIK